jgi:hypothetical protein
MEHKNSSFSQFPTTELYPKPENPVQNLLLSDTF